MAAGRLPVAWASIADERRRSAALQVELYRRRCRRAPGFVYDAGSGSESADLCCLGGFGERVHIPGGLIKNFEITGFFVYFADFVGREAAAGPIQHAGQNDFSV